MALARLLTAEDLEEMGSDAKRFELYDGVLWQKDAMGGQHGEIEIQLTRYLAPHVLDRRLGRLYPSDAHFLILRNFDKVVTPHLAFVRTDRLPPETARVGFMPVVPDFVVDVISQSDRTVAVIEKIRLYERAGVALIWLVQPRTRSVTVYILGQEPRTLREGEKLDGGEVFPGFTLAVSAVFA